MDDEEASQLRAALESVKNYMAVMAEAHRKTTVDMLSKILAIESVLIDAKVTTLVEIEKRRMAIVSGLDQRLAETGDEQADG